jgi:O-antigen/teichoic acid export membrane protein
LIWSSAIIVLYPYMAGLYQDTERFKTIFRVIISWIFGAIVGCVLVFVAFPDQIISLAFGKKFAESTNVLAIVSLQMLPIPFHGFLGRVLMVQNKQKIYCVVNFLALATNLILNVLLIRRWGLLGACISTLTTNVLLIFYYSWLGHLSLGDYFDVHRLLRILAVGIMAMAATLFMRFEHLAFSLVLFSVLYLTLAYFALNLKKEWRETMSLLSA